MNIIKFENYGPENEVSNRNSVNESELLESIKHLDFSSLNEQELEDLDRLAEENGICTFDLICMREGISDDFEFELLEESDDYYEIDEKKGWLKKAFNKARAIASKVVSVVGPIIQKAIPADASPKLKGFLGKFQSGLGKMSKKFPNVSKLISKSDSDPELAKTADIAQASLGKVFNDLKKNGAKALFSPDNMQTLKNVAPAFTAAVGTAKAIKKEIPPSTVPEEVEDAVEPDDDENDG
jgi:hypothetical protein